MSGVLVRRGCVCAAVGVAAAMAGSVTMSGVAVAATSCPSMTLTGTTTSLVLRPSSVTVDAGGCVEFANATALTATFTVGSYQQQVASGDHTSGATNYRAGAAGTTQKVTASELLGSARGTIVIRPAAQPSPSARTSAAAPPPQPPATQSPTSSQVGPQPTTAPSGGTAGPALAGAPVPSASPPPAGAAIGTPSAAAPYLAGRPTPAPSSSASAVIAGPLQPPTGRGAGLPAAVAALAVVATAGALLRVLLAEPVPPVDARRSVGRPLYSASDGTG